MAESIQRQMDLLQNAINPLEKAVPLIVTPSRHQDGLEYIIQASEVIKDLPFDEDFKSLSTSIKILTNGESLLLHTVPYQAFILDILESLTRLLNRMKEEGPPKETDASELKAVGEYLVRLAGRMTNRYKINIQFEEEYEAKSLRAFMVLKELSGVVRFLNVSPDISEKQANVNLENGLEIDVLSQESPEELHRIAGSVLEVQAIQIFTEAKAQPVMMLDPPGNVNSFDAKIEKFLSE